MWRRGISLAFGDSTQLIVAPITLANLNEHKSDYNPFSGKYSI
jgi:hypothetical protein